jgi:hypothetical protein
MNIKDQLGDKGVPLNNDIANEPCYEEDEEDEQTIEVERNKREWWD